jgi:TetR/AcrR family transcriptional regulator, transcriptional repressor for nem operon
VSCLITRKRDRCVFFCYPVEDMGKGEKTRQRIIVQAAPLFNQGGLAGCSMQDIMEATGLEKGGLYRHFSSKEELAAECLKYSLELAFKYRSGDADHVPNAVDKLRYLVDRFTSVPSPLKGGCPLMNAAVDADDGNLQLRRIAQEALRHWKSKLIQIVNDGLERGEVLSGTDPIRVANTMITVLEGSLLISRLEASPRARDDARATLEVLLDAIAIASPGTAPAKSAPGRSRGHK